MLRLRVLPSLPAKHQVRVGVRRFWNGAPGGIQVPILVKMLVHTDLRIDVLVDKTGTNVVVPNIFGVQDRYGRGYGEVISPSRRRSTGNTCIFASPP